MCGIVGQLGAPIEPGLLSAMCDRLAHRGPDDAGTLHGEVYGIGMRRLSVIDLVGGHQPVLNEDRSLAIVYNGEAYNFPKLREDLQRKGHLFTSRTDTETILHLYEEEGPECVDSLRGMFAFAIVDLRTGSALLARDRLGKKPLFYALISGTLIFASEMKALLLHPALRQASISPDGVSAYLAFGYVPGEQTILPPIKRLLPGHVLQFDEGRVSTRSYWRPSFEPKSQLDASEAVEMLDEKLREAVRIRLMSDVPLGVLLSGGIDSSAVAWATAAAAPGPVRSFCVGFAERDFDERPHAKLVASALGLEHNDVVMEPNVEDIFGDLVWHLDEPMNDSSAVPTYYLSKFAREHVTVALAGDGGDEAFAGYDRYRFERFAKLYRRLPGVLAKQVVPAVLSVVPSTGAKRGIVERAKRFASSAHSDPLAAYVRLMWLFDPELQGSLLSGEYVPEASQLVDGLRLASMERLEGLDLATRIDLDTYLPGDLLVKMDRMSMAHSLEVRSPLLDHEVMEFGWRLPQALKVRDGKGKWILRRLLGEVLPAEVLGRKKHGFAVPVDHWFRGPLKEWAGEQILGGELLRQDLFREEGLRRLLFEHYSRRRDHGQRIWGLLVLDAWLRQLPDMRSRGVAS